MGWIDYLPGLKWEKEALEWVGDKIGIGGDNDHRSNGDSSKNGTNNGNIPKTDDGNRNNDNSGGSDSWLEDNWKLLAGTGVGFIVLLMLVAYLRS